ncbi:Alkaline phosphatase [Folsomia candida]|uniref:alkaline phosphatase n=1 Tax=Folsomia candida TaxID=158441 RepID=A0A226DME4_FOLCA|nr:Alkaline phosphatase [Folsomia candida]
MMRFFYDVAIFYAGIVTTTRITHATPAAAYGHCAHRDWECDTKIPESERAFGCKDLARQLVEDEPGRNINVILGGGEQVLRAKMNESKACVRGDGQDLVWNWMQYQRAQKRKYRYVRTREQLLDEGVHPSTDFLLGLFAPNHIPYDKERSLGPYGQPSLEEMTHQAINILSRNPNGFVEGGRIDHAHHDNLAKIALEEVVAFDKAIQKGLAMTNLDDTMIVVTADHSHAFSMNGYPKRGNPIEGVGDKTPEGFAYQTLSYINGPGYTIHRTTNNMPGTNSTLQTRNTWKDLSHLGVNVTSDRTQVHLAGFWMDSETHGGEDVPVFSTGPMGHLLHGVHEQTHVPFAMAYSLCIGPYETKCRKGGGGGGDHHSKGHGHPAGKTNGGSTPSIARNNNNLWLLTTTTVFLLAISHTC